MIELGGSEAKRDELIAGMSNLTLEDKKIAMSPEEKKIRKEGDKGQSERLLGKKRKSPIK